MQQHESWKAARARLSGVPAAVGMRRPAPAVAAPKSPARAMSALTRFNHAMPYNGTTMHYGKPRKAVDFNYAVQLVCEDRGVTPNQVLNSPYCAAVAARHMLWTVLYDGNYNLADIAGRFGVDVSSVRLGIKSFREFQKGGVS